MVIWMGKLRKKPAITQIIPHSIHKTQQSRYSCAFISRPTSLTVSNGIFVFCFMKFMLSPHKLSHKHFKVVCNMYPWSLKNKRKQIYHTHKADKISDVTPAKWAKIRKLAPFTNSRAQVDSMGIWNVFSCNSFA